MAAVSPFILIEGGEVLSPAPIGPASVLVASEKIIKVGEVDRRALDRLGVEYKIIKADKCFVVPGFIDPHQHLSGASGNGGFSSATPPIFLSEIVTAGITTVVGTLGTDTTTTPMAALLARVKGLSESGMTAYCYSGGYNVPPSTITGRVRDDMLLISEIIGAGEICISDDRSTDPSAHELAKLVSDTHDGGLLTGKAGVSHFHVGPRPKRLALLRDLIANYDVQAEWLYPTHVERSEQLMLEALDLVRAGATIDIDVVEKDLPQWLRFYFEHDGDRGKCTVSSDSFMTSPANLWAQLQNCVREHSFSLDQVLPLVTCNTARILKLPSKGRIEPNMDADIVVLERDSLEIVHVIARGHIMVADGRVKTFDGFLHDSDRLIHLEGRKRGPAE
jgi:beta-aspartyl-dipeptidase (metallo-type)